LTVAPGDVSAKSTRVTSTIRTGEAPRVLVVDDFADNREMFAEYLELSGFSVLQAENGREAIDLARSSAPDVIVMDLSLPEISGWEATRILKADPRTCRVPVVALTGHALAEHAREAQRAGCDAFLAKPCLPDVLVAEVRRQLGRVAGDSARAVPGAPDFPPRSPEGKPG
jgi:CheY-like chemotaxis protein